MNKIVLTLASNFYDLTKSVISQVNEKSDWENVIIVPDRFSLLAELEVFNQSNLKSVFNTNVMPISRLASSLLDQVEIKINSVSKEEESFLVRRAIQKTKDKFVCFSKNLSPSMCDEIAKTISQLKSCKISPEKILTEDLSKSLQDKLNDIKTIYTEYENILSDQVDSGKLLEIFGENIEKIESLKNTNLFFVGFDSFTTQIFEVIKVLTKICPLIVMGGFYHFDKTNKRVFETDIYDKFKEFKNNANFEIVYVQNTLTQNQNLVLENVFSNNITKVENQNYFEVFSAENNQEQINFVLCEILKNIKLKNMKFSDFAIACANLESSKNELEKYLKKYKINYYIDSSEKLSNTSFAFFILGFFNLIQNNFDKVSLIDFLNTPFITENIYDKAVLVNLIEKYALEKGNFTDKKPNFLKEDLSHTEIYKKFNESVINIYKQVKNCQTIQDFVEATKQLMQTFSCKEKIERQAELCLIKNDLKQQKINLQLFDKVNQSLSSLEKYLQDEKVTLKEFYDLLKNSFESKTISTVPISGDCVFVGDATTSFFGKVKNLYLIDATYDALPKTIFDAGIINDDNIQQLNDVLKISPTIKAINKRNRFKILNLLSCPTEKLIITYTLLNSESKENLPASFIYDLCEIFNQTIKIPTKFVIDIEDYSQKDVKEMITKFYSPDFAKEFLFKNIMSKNKYKKEFINSVYQILISNGFVSESEINELQENNLPKINKAKELFFSKGRTSISQLENYFRSPFRHFLSYGLRLKEIETSDIKNLDIGNYLHYIAENFVNQIKDSKQITKEQIKDIVKLIENRAKSEEEFYKFSLTKENKSLLAYLNYEAINMCQTIFENSQKTNFKPVHTEKEFFAENYFEKQNLNLSGKVDRIDEFENYFTIIDYKTGRIEFNSNLVYTGQKLQLLIYADIYEKQTGKSCAGVFYFPVKNSFDNKTDYKLKGTFKRDSFVVLNLDNTLSYENPSSDFISAKISVSAENISAGKIEIGAIYGTEYLQEMIEYAKHVCKQAIDEILDGNIAQIEKEKQDSDLDIFKDDKHKSIKQNNAKIDEQIFKEVLENINGKN